SRTPTATSCISTPGSCGPSRHAVEPDPPVSGARSSRVELPGHVIGDAAGDAPQLRGGGEGQRPRDLGDAPGAGPDGRVLHREGRVEPARRLDATALDSCRTADLAVVHRGLLVKDHVRRRTVEVTELHAARTFLADRREAPRA